MLAKHPDSSDGTISQGVAGERGGQADKAPLGAMETVSRDLAVQLVNRSPAHVMLLDQNDIIIDVNARCEALLQSSAQALRGGSPTHVFAAILKRLKSIGVERAKQGFQIAYERSWYDAQVFDATIQGATDPQDVQVLRATDVTDRKAAEFEVLESEARLEEATRIANMGTYKLYWDTMKVIWSHHMYEIHGVTPGAMTPSETGYNDFIHPDDLASVLDMVNDLVSGREVAGWEYRIITPDGEQRWVRLEGRVLFDADGKPYATFGTVQDVTEAKNREEKLRELVARNTILTEALQASPVGIAVLTPDVNASTVFYANPALEQITGYETGTLIGRSIDCLKGRDTDPDVFGNLLGAVQAGRPQSCELQLSRQDGLTFLSEIEVAPVRIREGDELVAQTLIIRDVTDDRRRTDAIMESQKMEALGKLSGGVAHEINNLLQPIITLSDLGREACRPEDEKLLKYFEVITGSGRKAREIVRQVLTFSRQDAPLIGTHQLGAIVDDAANLARSGLPPGIDFHCHIDIDTATALVNPTQVSQVVINLVRNAADAMQGQGAIKLNLERCLSSRVPDLEDADAQQNWLLLSVEDSGSGIDSESRDRIFEPFFTTKPVGQGTGLGLSVVYSIVLGWGGRIEIDSEVDQGTTAMVYIPEIVEK